MTAIQTSTNTSTGRTTFDEEIVPGGGHTSFILKRGQILRIEDVEGGGNVGLLLFNAHQTSERLNLPDTLKGQHTARLTVGHCLYSDMGRVLAAIIAGTCGWHDSFGGVLNAQEVQEKYGQGRYQERRNGFFRNGMDNLLVEMGKWNLNLQDLLMTINLFSKVTVDAQGQFHFHANHSQAGDYIELYAPMDTLVVLTALQHPMDPNPTYAPQPIALTWSRAEGEDVAAYCRAFREENARAFHNTERFCL
ncbi:urea carboxylase-associated family protein [Pectobacterium polaris]|uniref:urea amidolyase associated protein UAAP1 n=1 Tax=Pectobacterium polaris TaxID=2042057 RepID=UPI001CF38A1B|nr:urea amidolyase associated protein UAAP1 [Pectobacterium polaris]MCA6941892.1 urea carboxylase-associated family protein [Pectobacterium polaris]MCA6957624.1 urea carboxylase-associated family protein [Pectobacterium polaris]